MDLLQLLCRQTQRRLHDRRLGPVVRYLEHAVIPEDFQQVLPAGHRMDTIRAVAETQILHGFAPRRVILAAGHIDRVRAHGTGRQQPVEDPAVGARRRMAQFRSRYRDQDAFPVLSFQGRVVHGQGRDPGLVEPLQELT